MLLNLLVIFSVVISTGAVYYDLKILENATQARCLDGTVSGYYFEKATQSSDNSKFVFYLQGGGECDNEDACKSQLETAHGSSTYFPKTSDSDYWYLGSGNCADNPEFCTWNHVNIPYCSQDLYSGQRTEVSEETFGLYFSGHLILSSILDEFDELYNLKEASEM